MPEKINNNSPESEKQPQSNPEAKTPTGNDINDKLDLIIEKVNCVENAVHDTELRVEMIRNSLGLKYDAEAVKSVAERDRLDALRNVQHSLEAEKAALGNIGEKRTPEQKAYLEKADAELDVITLSLVKRAQETDTLESSIFVKRKNAIEEVKAIMHGVVAPNEKIRFLSSNEIMISYSRKNEEWARKLALALQAQGMIVWLDNQETNVSSDKNADRKGIGVGNAWGESIDNGITGGYATVLLTHDMLDKFDVVGGREIISNMLEKDTSIIVAFVDDVKRGSILARLGRFLEEDAANEQYRPAIEALLRAPKVSLTDEDFGRKGHVLGERIIDAIPFDPNEENALRDQQEKSIVFEEGSLVESIEAFKEKVPGKDEKQKDSYRRALEECKIIIESQTDPKKIVDRGVLEQRSFFYGGVAGNEASYKPLEDAIVDTGLQIAEAGDDGYVLLPLKSGDITLPHNEFGEQFKALAEKEDEHLRLWTLVGPDFFSTLTQEIEKSKAEELAWGEKRWQMDYRTYVEKKTSIQRKTALLKKIQKSQGLILWEKDLNDPSGLASYLLMKQALVDSNKSKHG